jgi:hypothetical protein
MDGRRPASAGAQNPAYRPARPPPTLLTCISAGLSSIRGHIGGTHARSGECLVQRIPGAATGLRDQVPVQVHTAAQLYAVLSLEDTLRELVAQVAQLTKELVTASRRR